MDASTQCADGLRWSWQTVGDVLILRANGPLGAGGAEAARTRLWHARNSGVVPVLDVRGAVLLPGLTGELPARGVPLALLALEVQRATAETWAYSACNAGLLLMPFTDEHEAVSWAAARARNRRWAQQRAPGPARRRLGYQ